MVEYESYEQTSIPWNEKRPSHWRECRGKALFSTRKEKNIGNLETNVLSLTLRGVVRNSKDNPIGLSPSDYSTYQIFEKDDLVFKLIDLNNISTSRVGLVPERGIMSSAYIRLIARRDLNIRYFYMQYYNLWLRNVYNGLGAGVRQTIPADELLNMSIVVPPRAEQDQIVRFLDWKVSEINKLIGIRRKEIRELRNLKNAVVCQFVTRGLDKHAEMKYSGVNWLGDIPKEWKVVKLRQILHSVSEKNHPELPLLSVAREQGVIIRDVEDTELNHNYIPDDLSNYKVVRKHQFAMNKMKAWQGSYGVSPYTGIVSPAYFIFDIDFPNLEYFHYAIRSKVYVNFFAQASDGIRVGQWDLQMDKMKEIPFLVPSAEEQSEIVEAIKGLQVKCDSRIDDLHKEIEVLIELKDKIISDVVAGKIDVRNVTVPEYEHVDDIADDDSENDEEADESNINGEED